MILGFIYFSALKLDDRLKQVFVKLPLDKIKKIAGSMTEDHNVVKEYLCFKAYLVSSKTKIATLPNKI